MCFFNNLTVTGDPYTLSIGALVRDIQPSTTCHHKQLKKGRVSIIRFISISEMKQTNRVNKQEQTKASKHKYQIKLPILSY